MEFIIASVFAAGLIAGLTLLARRNRAQGWRKPRKSWFDVQADAASRAFAAGQAEASSRGPLEHLRDLQRLQQALTAHAPLPQEKAVAQGKETVSRSH
jgi:hypothetical protein